MAGEDFTALSEMLTFAVEDFTAVGTTHYEASKDVTLDHHRRRPRRRRRDVLHRALGQRRRDRPAHARRSAHHRPSPTTTTRRGAPATLAAQGGFNEATLTWTAPATAGTSDIEGYDYRVSDETAAPYTWEPDWTAIPDSGAGDENATSYTVAMHAGAALVNGTPYTFEVRARSAAGGGEGTRKRRRRRMRSAGEPAKCGRPSSRRRRRHTARA